VAVPVVEIADLVILKVLASRPKDLDDVVMLLRVHGDGIDTSRIRTVLKMLEQALGQRSEQRVRTLPNARRILRGSK
jgi:hypothetical protein